METKNKFQKLVEEMVDKDLEDQEKITLLTVVYKENSSKIVLSIFVCNL